MAAQITAVLTNLFIIHECSITIEITELNSHDLRTIVTPGFSPLPNVSVEFYFEALYQSIKVPNKEDGEYDLFKLNLTKRVDYAISSTLKMNLDVEVLYSDYTYFQKYKPLKDVNVADMDTIRFEDVFAPLKWLHVFNSDHHYKMLKKTLILKCHFLFSDERIPLALLHDREVQSLSNLRTFNQEFSLTFKPYFPAEIEFHVGNKIVLAHRAVLLAHSPVFKKMMLNKDFKEPFKITLPGVSYQACVCFVNYMYTGDIEDKSWPIVKELYILAAKYKVLTLKRESSSLIASYLSFDQVCEILKLAHAHGDAELKQTSNQYAVIHYLELASKKEWKKLIVSYPSIGREVMDAVILKSHSDLVDALN